MKKINVLTALTMMVALLFSVASVNAQVTKDEKKAAKAQEKVVKTTEKNLFSASPKEVQKATEDMLFKHLQTPLTNGKAFEVKKVYIE